ncbi:bifunctional YncE family protein/alkaline phosphatase family protein [Adhaeribacter radiodurans]|uniref:Bifunctional YncE family protein/alkaline phosphatase family protein n=1 Tax=Adhaeribacter radiodurans TaxID=2745197 RepID=A0A7L7L419_9BACT|nr:bifunctional YncE family protein/alkaline phosphatase family protein [Adhaeribacter radiodurans]QMU27514.1 bifunctional YncE family protein/alkaline phosphatase family protein [Adhaeribacter radiodurans]
MKKQLYSLVLFFVFMGVGFTGTAQTPTNNPEAKNVLLPNGWSLSPAGRSLPLGDLPLNLQLAPSKKLLAVTNNGHGNQIIQLINPKTEKLLDEKVIKKSWYGLKFSADSKKLYVSGGNDNRILVYPIQNNKLGTADTIALGQPWPKEKISPTGLDVDDKRKLLYSVTKDDSTLYVVDLTTGKTRQKVKLGSEAYACLLSPDKTELYISLWGGDKLAIFNINTQKITTEIKTENHPNELLLTKSGKYLFVANASDNSVSVIDIKARKVIEIISAALYPTKLTGSTTNALALAPDEKTLYIGNADNNCVAVFNVEEPGKSSAKGFIPTGWYPTNIKTLGKKIMVANGKGFSSLPNPAGPQPVKVTDNSGSHRGVTDKQEVQYIGGLFKGTLSFIDRPKEEQLKIYSQQVYKNTPFNLQAEAQAKSEPGNPIPGKLGEKSPIKYVFYVIKENRTYDQILGDMKEGNGDPNLCLFPEKVTPNHHALAREFVLLDNFYVNAEVSADGHNWSMAAYANDYVEKTWPTSYSGRGGTYDYEGSRKIAYPRDGFIWDYCLRAGVSYRSYGEFANKGKTSLKSLRGHICKAAPGFDMDIKDVERVRIWKQDFDSLLAKNAVPQFSTIRLSNDHTSGQRKGKITPIAAVADNDLALGQLVEHISKSGIWKESAIFVLEDDAQNGPDHIDAHRSPAFVISPYTKRNSVNHTMYTTSGVLRTMELILGLPPMSQYDAAALPLFGCFSSQPDLTGYSAKPAQVDLEERNVAWNKSAERSEHFNLAAEDSAPDLDLNEVVWKSIKGEDSVMPAPRRSAFLKLKAEEENEEED